jgi:hypothetical protein
LGILNLSGQDVSHELAELNGITRAFEALGLAGWCATLILPPRDRFTTRGGTVRALFVHARNMPSGAAGCERRLGALIFKLDRHPFSDLRAHASAV